MDLSFFGLTSEVAKQVRVNLFIQIHEIVFHGQGGYDWETVYNMPIWLRRFTYNNIKEFYENEKEEYDKAMNKPKTVTANTKIDKPAIASKPTYSTKAVKK